MLTAGIRSAARSGGAVSLELTSRIRLIPKTPRNRRSEPRQDRHTLKYVVLGGSPIREEPGRVGAAPTKPGRVSTARWRGSGERGGEEYVRNHRYYVS